MAKNLTGIKQTRTLKLFRETEYGDDEEGLSAPALPGVSAGHPGTPGCGEWFGLYSKSNGKPLQGLVRQEMGSD